MNQQQQQPGASNTQPPNAGGPYANQQAPKQHMEYICAGVPSGYSAFPLPLKLALIKTVASRTRSGRENPSVVENAAIASCTKRGLRDVRFAATTSSHFDFNPCFSGAVRGSVMVSTLSTVARCVVARAITSEEI